MTYTDTNRICNEWNFILLNIIKLIFVLFFSLLISSFSFATDGYIRGGEFKSYLKEKDFYFNKIQPVLEKRCVVCHSCIEAPCQLKLTSAEMLQRGANKHSPFGSNFESAPRTDLMFNILDQRKGGFFSVRKDEGNGSILSVLLKQGRENTDANNISNMVAEKYVEIENRTCVASTNEFYKLSQDDQKRMGMPYYTAPLKDGEYKDLIEWADNGAKLPDEKILAERKKSSNPEIINKWEEFFNSRSWKAKWTSRYLYEHLFTAHFYFDEIPGEFYELVRSRTPSPYGISRIRTERPFEMPEEFENSFFYRLQKVDSTIVQKQHFVYHVNNKTINELKKLFWKPNWLSTEEKKPFNFKLKNPFAAFEHIPANSRYRWMLKNARMLIDMDMRSDNCHGEGATGPLRESFLLMFVKPESDVSVQFPDFFKRTIPYLKMTNADATGVTNNAVLEEFFSQNQVGYSIIKKEYQDQLLKGGLIFEDIWNGKGNDFGEEENSDVKNGNKDKNEKTQVPFFTVMRHEKTASVHNGAWGPQQRVSALFDYVSFERLYYNCVALEVLYDAVFNKIGNVLYLRTVAREVEQQIMSLVPEQYRKDVREEWIQAEGAKHQFDDSRFVTPFNEKLSQLPGFYVDPNDPFRSVMDYLLLKSGRFTLKDVGPFHYPLNKGTTEFLHLKNASLEMNKKVPEAKGNRAQYFPNISYLVVKENNKQRYYTIVANRFYDYVNYLPIDANPYDRLGRNPSKDWMSIFPGIQVNYPGKIFIVDKSELTQFTQKMNSVYDKGSYAEFDQIYGLQKMDKNFWDIIDNIQNYFIQKDIINHGSLDLREYGNHDLLGTP